MLESLYTCTSNFIFNYSDAWHWILVVVLIQEGRQVSNVKFDEFFVYSRIRALVLDSLVAAGKSRNDLIVANISQFFSVILGKEVHLQTISVKVIKLATTPQIIQPTYQVKQQEGGVDCGIHVIHNMKLLSSVNSDKLRYKSD